MRYYFFDRHYGHDRVAESATLKGVGPGDLFEARGIGYVVCLGESISRVEQYTKYVEHQLVDAEIFLLGSLFSDQGLQMIDRFVHQWFCSYKKALPLRTGDIEELVKRAPKKKQKKKDVSAEQTLTIYPNIRSILNDPRFDVKDASNTVLHSQTTKKQKAEAYWKIQSGMPVDLVCTYSQMFQDRKHLTKITLYDQHMRYYKNQQDPRYHTIDVVQKLQEIYACEVTTTGLHI